MRIDLNNIDLMCRATLYRNGGPAWEFEPDPMVGALAHWTSRHNVYAILDGLHYGKPFWVARRVDAGWATVEREIGASEIRFDNGGRYIFPR